MSRLGQQMFFVRKRSANEATATAPMLVTKALSQNVMVLAFVPQFADPQGVAQPTLQSTYIQGKFFSRIFMLSLLYCFCYKRAMKVLFLQILFSH
ncbi:hypothetical protein [Lysinibacillus sp. NPDC093216]|uniref:hypothetical protein n=1 Tax=Lysinibacillus sp. NPDC093216 TaxID=3390576 RepID=UPI003CFE7092